MVFADSLEDSLGGTSGGKSTFSRAVSRSLGLLTESSLRLEPGLIGMGGVGVGGVGEATGVANVFSSSTSEVFIGDEGTVGTDTTGDRDGGMVCVGELG